MDDRRSLSLRRRLPISSPVSQRSNCRLASACESTAAEDRHGIEGVRQRTPNIVDACGEAPLTRILLKSSSLLLNHTGPGRVINRTGLTAIGDSPFRQPTRLAATSALRKDLLLKLRRAHRNWHIQILDAQDSPASRFSYIRVEA
jgi:hypothetical protein